MTRANVIRIVFASVAIGVVVLAAGAAAYLAARRAGTPLLPATQVASYTASTSPLHSGAATAARHKRKRPPPEHITRLTKVPPTAISDGTGHIAIRLSWLPAANTPRPVITPAIAGTWTDVVNYEVFNPASTFEPCSSYTMTIPAGTIAEDHRPLGVSSTVKFTVACPGTIGLQQALARLGYIPYHFASEYGIRYKRGPEARRIAAKHAYDPPHGLMLADHPDVPPLEYGTLDPVTEGALEIFQSDHDLQVTGQPDAATWAAILGAETLGHRAPTPYTWVTVSEDLPETLEVHQGGKILVTTPANTGVPGAATPEGVFPIYARYVSTTMIGTDVDGTKYDVPDVPWVNYFNGGDAVHGYPRTSYGFPQSNGCVELPIGTAEAVFNLLQDGDIVYVT